VRCEKLRDRSAQVLRKRFLDFEQFMATEALADNLDAALWVDEKEGRNIVKLVGA